MTTTRAKPGRKPRAFPDCLAARVWFRAVALRTRLETAYQLECRFDPEHVRRDADGKTVRPRLWDRYRRGLVGPDDSADPECRVSRIERAVPGTAQWFRHPLWRALSVESLTQTQVDRRLGELGPDVRALLFETAEDGLAGKPSRLPFDGAAGTTLAELGSLDALAAVLLLIKESEAIGSPELRDLALNAYVAIQPLIVKIPEMTPFVPELFCYIDTTFAHRIFPHANKPMRIVIFWEGVRDACWPEDAKALISPTDPPGPNPGGHADSPDSE